MNANTVLKAVQSEFDAGGVGTDGKAFWYDAKMNGKIVFMWDTTVEDDAVKTKLRSLNCDVEMFGNGYAVIGVEA